MILAILGHDFHYEMECILRLFFPRAQIAVVREQPDTAEDAVFTRVEQRENQLCLSVEGCLSGVRWNKEHVLATTTAQEDVELALARLLYAALVDMIGIEPPWGVLTGVRPVRLCRNLREAMPDVQVRQRLRENYLVSERKIDQLFRVCDVQRTLLPQMLPRGFSLYVSIPFCPSRCLYCSFVSHDIQGAAKRIPVYVQRLCEEIRCTGALAARLGLQLQTIYVGGGTPTSLEADQLGVIMQVIAESFDMSALTEYTVEAGRPDTITPEKLQYMRRMGVNRVSINPQTMDDGILRIIGRNHTAEQTRIAYHMARDTGFSTINMDLIAGLPGDDGTAFRRTLQETLEMAPENITIHTLTVKRSSRLRESGKAVEAANGLGTLLDAADDAVAAAGYQPYYLYRQKGTVANLENVGYAKPGTESLYNVLIMEEVQTILAVGAGAVTKICRETKPLQRVFNYKFPHEYLDRFEDILQRKAKIERIMEDTP